MKFNVIKGNLFDASPDCILVHCISADFALGAGIAKTFREEYGVAAALELCYKINHWNNKGYCLLTPSRDRNNNKRWLVANLVTKERSYHKPTYDSLRQALENFKIYVFDCNRSESLENVQIAMPLIGCGLDGLNWEKVEAIIKDVFKDTKAEITVYVLP